MQKQTENKDKFVSTAKVGEKGQIVIPKDLRDMFGIKPGDTLLIFGDINQGIAIVSYDKYKNFTDNIFGNNKGEE